MLIRNIFQKGFLFFLPLSVFCEYLKARGLLGYDIFYALFKIILLYLAIASFFSDKHNKVISQLMLLFICYTLLSGIMYFFNTRPIDCYYDALMSYVLPMGIFFIGKSNINTDSFCTYYKYAFVFMILITLPAFFSLSPWYISFINSTRELNDVEYGAEFWADQLRFSGVYGTPYSIMYTGLPLLIFELSIFFKLKGTNIIISGVIILTLIIALLCCQQRTALLFILVSMFFFVFYKYRDHKIMSNTILIVFSICIILTSVWIGGDRFEQMWELVADRFQNMSFTSAFGDRSEKVLRVFPVWENYLTGDGVGVYSHVAHSMGFISVNDCAWIKILVENGIIGVLFFCYIVFLSIRKAIRHFSHNVAEILIILFYLVAMIGSNSLSMEYTMSLFFWLSIGRIWRIEHSL